MRIRAMEEKDVPGVVQAWNQALRHHPVTEERFRRVVLEDPNYEPDGVFVADGGGSILGFAQAVVRRTVPGNDGGGQEWNFSRGFLKAFFMAYGDAAWPAGLRLLEPVEQFCAATGKRQVIATMYSGPYFWPGMDLRYPRLCDVLQRAGYRDVATIEDVGIDLQLPLVDEIHARVCASLPADVSVLPWDPSLLPAMKPFVAEGATPYWFPPGWEKGLAVPHDNVFLLRKGEEILGWAQYTPGVPRSGFGPILVLPRVRRNNYGARLLLECMLHARGAGSTFMTAGWANTGFYTRHGWSILRRYAVMVKELSK